MFPSCIYVCVGERGRGDNREKENAQNKIKLTYICMSQLQIPPCSICFLYTKLLFFQSQSSKCNDTKLQVGFKVNVINVYNNYFMDLSITRSSMTLSRLFFSHLLPINDFS